MDDLVIAFSGNLSRGGLFIKTDQLLPTGSEVTLTLELPDGAPEIQVPCNVVFVRDQGVRGMGVKFIDPDDQTRKRIEWFIINAAPSSEELQAQAATRKLDVVVVDDDPLQSKAAAEAFRARGDTVRVARDGLEGLALCLKQKPDVVLTDVQMPKMDGWQMVRMLRAREAFAKLPIVFLTTLSSEADRLVGYRLGVEDYLEKPYDPSDLLTRVDRVVLRAEQQSALEPSSVGEGLSGDLVQVGMASILSFLEVERRTGVLRVGPATNGRIWISEGRPLQAEAHAPEGPLQGRDAINSLLDAKAGRFEFREEPVACADEIQSTLSGLLLEHARLSDERSSA